MPSSNRIPGIYFETVGPARDAALPPMDVAAFAGFAASGPLDVPVAIEDVERFHELFGTDLTLAWDDARGEMALAQLPVAVRSFFRNGGRRCWVVRLARGVDDVVAGADPNAVAARSNTFVVPGLLRVDGDGSFHAGWVQARSEGSWSDGFSVNATLIDDRRAGVTLSVAGDRPAVSGLAPGDLACITFPSTRTIAYVGAGPDALWFRSAAGPPASTLQSAFALDVGDRPLAFTGFAVDGADFALEVARADAAGIALGSWLRLHFGEGVLLMQVEQTRGVDRVALVGRRAWWAVDAATAWAENRNRPFSLAVTNIELWARPENGPTARLAGLGFLDAHERHWAALPTDRELFAAVDRPDAIAKPRLRAAADHPRYPLAGPYSKPAVSVPLGIGSIPLDEFYQPPTPARSADETPLHRDGLGVFDAGLFVDWQLADSSASTLLNDAFTQQYRTVDRPRLPTHLHAILPVEEVSLLAVPDATHAGWERRTVAADVLLAPDVVTTNRTLSWPAILGADEYAVEESTDTQFAREVRATSQAGTSVTVDAASDCPVTRYVRVGAQHGAVRSPWSATAVVITGQGPFAECVPSRLDAPDLTSSEARGRLSFAWRLPGAVAAEFRFEMAADPRFAGARVLYAGPAQAFELWNVPGTAAYFRVAAFRDGQSGPWSKTVTRTAPDRSPWHVKASAGAPASLLDVQLAALRIAGARGDLVAVLSAPSWMTVRQAAEHVGGLVRHVRALDDERLLSFAAVHHPWTLSRDGIAPDASSRLAAPDGAMCGLMAAHSINAGAWVAAANVPFTGVVALEPAPEPGASALARAARLNLLLQNERGFVTLSQDTLSTDVTLRPLNVRRLLILLRRLAMREGPSHVFRNNDATFQRLVRRQFEHWMRELLARGAFAGSTAEESFRVVTGPSVNPPEALDQGRFVVELRVAPSLPMEFLAVKLVQSGGDVSFEEL